MTTSQSGPHWTSAPVTTPGPRFSIVSTLGSSVWNRTRSRLIAMTISVTSSFTPSMLENSCLTPWIFSEVTAVPSMEDRRTRLRPLPTVTP